MRRNTLVRRHAALAGAVAALRPIQIRGREAARRLVAGVNASADYETWCAAWLASSPPLPTKLRAAVRRGMRQPHTWWRDAYAETRLVEQILLDSADLLSTGQLDARAIQRFNAY